VGGESLPQSQAKETWVVDASMQNIRERLSEFWQYRRLVLSFFKRVIQVLYQCLRLGISWLLAHPLLSIVISIAIVGGLFGVPLEGLPYFFYFLIGSMAWLLFERLGFVGGESPPQSQTKETWVVDVSAKNIQKHFSEFWQYPRIAWVFFKKLMQALYQAMRVDILVERSLGFVGGESLPDSQVKETWVVDGSHQNIQERLLEFWRYRRIALFFSKKFIQGLYQGMRLGIFWLFARPLMPIVISVFIFGGLLGVPSEGLPYFLFFLTGSVTWLLFERSLLFVTRSLDMSKGLMKRVYFPRLIVPFCAVSPAIVYFLVYMGLFVAALVYYLVADGEWYLVFGPRLFMAVVAVFMAVWLSIAVGLWTTVWMTHFREIRITIRYVSRFWFYLTPVIYPISEVPEEYRWIIFVNPMASVVETFKWSTLGVGAFYPIPLLTSLLVTAIVFTGGVWYFGRAEGVAIDKL